MRLSIGPDLERKILWIRGHRVMLDRDLALLYGVPTKRLNEQLRRNARRFPPDFAFRLTALEASHLRSQNATSSSVHGGRRSRPWVFTEHGALMIANVLSSPGAVRASVHVVRAFVRLRNLLGAQAALVRRLDALESKYDRQFKAIFDAVRSLMAVPAEDPPRERIGFVGPRRTVHVGRGGMSGPPRRRVGRRKARRPTDHP
jgi:hypothetical protein